jgi:hypothetical protein
MNILCVATLSSCWDLHAKQELTLLAALRERGHSIDYVICDGLFSVCEGADKDYLPMSRCFHCRRHGRRRARQLGFEAMPLRGFHRFRDRLKARLFVNSLADNDLHTSRYGNYELGRWVRSSIMTACRLSRYTPGNARFDTVYRQYIENALCEAWAVERYLHAKQYDRIILFNGRMAYTKVVLELAKMRGIPVYVHERGTLKEYISFALNEFTAGFDIQRKFWNAWKDIPLTTQEIKDTASYLYGREQGDQEQLNWFPFTDAPSCAEQLRDKLSIARDKKVWALFTSSIFEMVQISGFDSFGFRSQYHWIECAIKIVAKYPDVHLVIRAHPNLCAINSNKTDDAEWKYYKNLKKCISGNVTIIEPDEAISTYDLINLADIGLAYISTCGLEMASKGKPVCIGATTYYDGIEKIDKAYSQELMDSILSKYAKLPHKFIDIHLMRLAMRFWHSHIFYKTFPFHFVKMHHTTGGKFAFNSCKELAHGNDALLDHICSTTELGKSPLLTPTDEMYNRSTNDEDEFYKRVVSEEGYVIS